MNKKVKKFFSFPFENKLLFWSLLIAFLGIVYPLRPAFAWVDKIVGAVTTAPAFLLVLLLGIIGAVTALLASFSGVILTWVISPKFTTLSYTNPANNEIIRIGLGITQGMVNMTLILVLVYIAIATILRLAGYETKKLLITFIIVALLVNFAPVICGVIVDASNIIMNFYLRELTGGQRLINNLGTVKDTLLSGLTVDIFKGSKQLDLVLEILVISIVNFALFLVLLLFAIIFAVRYIAIWILVILSPLAFACYILPATKKYFTLWWNQFIQWSIIGMTCAFFLYLAEQFIALGTSVYGTVPAGIGSSILPNIIPLVFLFIGLMFGLQTSALGASGVINVSKRAGRWTGRRIWRGAVPIAEEKLKLKEKMKKIVTGTRIAEERWKIPGTKITFPAPGIQDIPIVRWFLPEKLRGYGEFGKALKEGEAGLGDYSSPTLASRIATGADKGGQAAANLLEIIKRNDGQDLMTTYKKKIYGEKWKDKTNEELLEDDRFKNDKYLVRALEIAQGAGKLGAVLRGEPRLARVAAGKVGAYKNLDERKAIAKAINESRSQHIANWEPEVFEDQLVAEATIGIFDRDRTLAISRSVKKGLPSALAAYDKSFTNFVKNKKLEGESKEKQIEKYKEYIKENYKTALYFTSIEDPRAEKAGWRKPEYLGAKGPTIGEEMLGPKEEKPEGPPVAPGPAEKKPNTGEARKRRKKYPDTGEAGRKK